MVRAFTPEEHKQWFDSLPSRPSGAAVMAFNDKGEVLAIKATYKHHWSLPGGVVEQGETPRRGAAREFTEETGVELDPNNLEFAFVRFRRRDRDEGDSTYFVFKTLVDDKNLEVKPQDTDEVEYIRWMSPEEFRNSCGDHTHWVQASRVAAGETGLEYGED